MIGVRGLTKTYVDHKVRVEAVRDVSFDIVSGEVALVMGPSGGGKTTLLSMIGCILSPTRGEILLEGREVTRLGEDELALVRREKIGFVFQTFNLLRALTARENVGVVLGLAGRDGGASQERAEDLLRKVGLGERLDFLPEDLSGGEKQRVAIARALALDPPIVLADEPTGNLDSASGMAVIRLLKELSVAGGKAVVIVTHDPRIEPLADRKFLMEDGRVSEVIGFHGSASGGQR